MNSNQAARWALGIRKAIHEEVKLEEDAEPELERVVVALDARVEAALIMAAAMYQTLDFIEKKLEKIWEALP